MVCFVKEPHKALAILARRFDPHFDFDEISINIMIFRMQARSDIQMPINSQPFVHGAIHGVVGGSLVEGNPRLSRGGGSNRKKTNH